jgi:hypothetical protein
MMDSFGFNVVWGKTEALKTTKNATNSSIHQGVA